MNARRTPPAHAPRPMAPALTLAALLLAAALLASAAEAAPDKTELECVGSYNEALQGSAERQMCEETNGCEDNHGFVQYTHYVYLNQGFTLRVLDLADPAHPAETAWLRFKSKNHALILKWPALYVGNSIYDVTDPAHPRLRATIPEMGADNNLRAVGHHLINEERDMKYVEYRVYDAQDPFNPRQIHRGNRRLDFRGRSGPIFSPSAAARRSKARNSTRRRGGITTRITTTKTTRRPQAGR